MSRKSTIDSINKLFISLLFMSTSLISPIVANIETTDPIDHIIFTENDESLSPTQFRKRSRNKKQTGLLLFILLQIMICEALPHETSNRWRILDQVKISISLST